MCHGQSTVYRFGLSIIINYWVSLTLWWYDHAPGYCRSSGCFLLVDHDHVPWLGATLLMGWPNNYIIYACGLWKFVKPPCFFDIYRWLSDFSIKKHNVPIKKHHFPIKNTRIHHFVRTCSSIGYLGSAGGSTMNLSQLARKVIWLGKPKTMWKSDGFLFGTWSTNGGVWLHIYIIYAGWKDDIYIYIFIGYNHYTHMDYIQRLFPCWTSMAYPH